MESRAPRENPLVKLIDERIKKRDRKTRGLSLPAGSGAFFRELSMGPFESAVTTTMNVQLRGDRAQANKDRNLPAILDHVPIALNNRSYAFARFTQTPVELSKSESGKIEITGLSKRGPGITARRFEVSPVSGVIVPGSVTVIGIQIWPIEYGDFPEAGGYGYVPYGAMAMYNGAGDFVELIGS